MKKLLLIGLILAICILAFPQGVLAADSIAEVNANIQETLSFTATGPSGEWALTPVATTTTATNAEGITFDVTSNALWNVNVKSTTPANGKMVPFMVESGATPLDKVLKIEGITPGSFQDVTSIVDILSELKTDADGTLYYKKLQQETVITDSRLMAAFNHYTIDLTFECIQSA